MIVVAPLERSLRPSTSFILRFKRLYLSLEKNLDSICSPHGDASTEKVRIFGPHCTCQSECCGEYWPITFVSTAQHLPGKVGSAAGTHTRFQSWPIPSEYCGQPRSSAVVAE